MNKQRFLMAIGVFGVAAALVVSIPLTELRADHCHPVQSQPSTPEVKESAGKKASIADRQRSTTSIPVPQGRTVRSGSPGSSGGPVDSANASLEEIYSRDLPMAISSIGQAVRAIEAGDRRTELTELNKAVNLLIQIRTSLGRHVKPQFANSRCPMMSSVINRDGGDSTLTRDYKGQKIAFCCGACPSAWDRLTEAQKQVKLSAVKS